jgi:hypothetical protein
MHWRHCMRWKSTDVSERACHPCANATASMRRTFSHTCPDGHTQTHTLVHAHMHARAHAPAKAKHNVVTNFCAHCDRAGDDCGRTSCSDAVNCSTAQLHLVVLENQIKLNNHSLKTQPKAQLPNNSLELDQPPCQRKMYLNLSCK